MNSCSGLGESVYYKYIPNQLKAFIKYKDDSVAANLVAKSKITIANYELKLKYKMGIHESGQIIHEFDKKRILFTNVARSTTSEYNESYLSVLSNETIDTIIENEDKGCWLISFTSEISINLKHFILNLLNIDLIHYLCLMYLKERGVI